MKVNATVQKNPSAIINLSPRCESNLTLCPDQLVLSSRSVTPRCALDQGGLTEPQLPPRPTVCMSDAHTASVHPSPHGSNTPVPTASATPLFNADTTSAHPSPQASSTPVPATSAMPSSNADTAITHPLTRENSTPVPAASVTPSAQPQGENNFVYCYVIVGLVGVIVITAVVGLISTIVLCIRRCQKRQGVCKKTSSRPRKQPTLIYLCMKNDIYDMLCYDSIHAYAHMLFKRGLPTLT